MWRRRLAAAVLMLSLLPPPPAAARAEDADFTPLVLGETLYSYLPSSGRDDDPQRVFKLEDGVLHVLDLPESDQPRDFGYLTTTRDYSNYHVRLRYRWGQKRFAPRALDKRDAGLLYHVVGPDVIWPRSVECQIQEGDTGDIFLVNGTGASTTIDPRFGEPQYLEGGAPYSQIDGRIIKGSTVDSLTDWNTVEAIVTGTESAHIVNGVVVARVSGMSQPSADNPDQRVPLDHGRILFQAEGAEVFYDHIEIKEFPISVCLFRQMVCCCGTTCRSAPAAATSRPRFRSTTSGCTSNSSCHRRRHRSPNRNAATLASTCRAATRCRCSTHSARRSPIRTMLPPCTH